MILQLSIIDCIDRNYYYIDKHTHTSTQNRHVFAQQFEQQNYSCMIRLHSHI